MYWWYCLIISPQMMEKNHGFWDKVDQDMKVMNKKNDEYKK